MIQKRTETKHIWSNRSADDASAQRVPKVHRYHHWRFWHVFPPMLQPHYLWQGEVSPTEATWSNAELSFLHLPSVLEKAPRTQPSGQDFEPQPFSTAPAAQLKRNKQYWSQSKSYLWEQRAVNIAVELVTSLNWVKNCARSDRSNCLGTYQNGMVLKILTFPKESTDEPFPNACSSSCNPWMNDWMNEWTKEWMSERMHACHECMNAWMTDWISTWRKERMKEWKKEQRKEWMNGVSNQGRKEWMKEGRKEWMEDWRNWRNWMKIWRKEGMNERTNEWMDGDEIGKTDEKPNKSRFLGVFVFNISIPNHVQSKKQQGRGWRSGALSMFESKSAGSLVDNPFLCRVAALYLSSQQGGKRWENGKHSGRGLRSRLLVGCFGNLELSKPIYNWHLSLGTVRIASLGQRVATNWRSSIPFWHCPFSPTALPCI